MRSQRGQVWPYLLLSVALLGALGFGWFQTRQKNQLALDTENKYMSAFHKLKWTSENIEERTARLLATNDPRLQESLLADLRVFSAQAVEHMSTLPMLTMNTPRITNFLNTLRWRSDELHEKINQGTPLAAQDWSELAELRKQAVFFEAELSNLLGLVGNNMIRWRDTVRVTSPAESGAGETPITKSIMQMEKALAAPPGEENALAPGVSPLARPKIDPGVPVSPDQAATAITRFTEIPLKEAPKLTGRTEPPDKTQSFSLYFFDATKANGTPMNFGVSVHGGHVIFMVDGRPIRERRFNQDQLIDRARAMLNRWGYPGAEFISAAENGGTLMMDFAPSHDGVAVHTEMIKVSMAMDNAELLGFDARNYWVNRKKRGTATAALSAEAARARLAPRLQVEQAPRLAVVADRRGREQLVWEIRAGLDDQHYMIFIDANTGDEVNLLRLTGDPAPPLNEG